MCVLCANHEEDPLQLAKDYLMRIAGTHLIFPSGFAQETWFALCAGFCGTVLRPKYIKVDKARSLEEYV